MRVTLLRKEYKRSRLRIFFFIKRSCTLPFFFRFFAKTKVVQFPFFFSFYNLKKLISLLIEVPTNQFCTLHMPCGEKCCVHKILNWTFGNVALTLYLNEIFVWQPVLHAALVHCCIVILSMPHAFNVHSFYELWAVLFNYYLAYEFYFTFSYDK